MPSHKVMYPMNLDLKVYVRTSPYSIIACSDFVDYGILFQANEILQISTGQIEEYIDKGRYILEGTYYAILGTLNLDTRAEVYSCLLLLSKCTRVANINGIHVYKVTDVRVLPLTATVPPQPGEVPAKQLADNARIFLQNGSFYFSSNGDLTLSSGRKALNTGSDAQFIWNRSMLRDLRVLSISKPFTVDLIRGYVGVREQILLEPASPPSTSPRSTVYNGHLVLSEDSQSSDASELEKFPPERPSPRALPFEVAVQKSGLAAVGRTSSSMDAPSRSQPKKKRVQVILISRTGYKRSGARFKTRGIDDNGYVANFVETEQIMIFENVLFSYTQVRGSVPLFWEQPGYNIGRHKLSLLRSEDAMMPAFTKHFYHLQKNYGPVTIIDLLSQSISNNDIDGEKALSLMYLNCSNNILNKYINQHVQFDFHERCKGNSFRALDQLIQTLQSDFKLHSYYKHEQRSVETPQTDQSANAQRKTTGSSNFLFENLSPQAQPQVPLQMSAADPFPPPRPRSASKYSSASFSQTAPPPRPPPLPQQQQSAPSKTLPKSQTFKTVPISFQQGVFRVNCLDCLDRTNAVMSKIGIYLLRKQLAELGIPQSMFYLIESEAKRLWHESGDAISYSYAGSGAIKSEVTLSGQQSKRGMITDFFKSATRLYRNTVEDSGKQETIDFIIKNRYRYDLMIEKGRNLGTLQAVMDQAQDFTHRLDLNIFTGTWNVCGNHSISPQTTLKSWFINTLPEEMKDKIDMFVFGLQEIVGLDVGSVINVERKNRMIWEKNFAETLKQHIPYQNYSRLVVEQMVGLCLFIFVRSDIIDHVKDVVISTTKLSMKGFFGTKGALAARLNVKSTTLCFVLSHFAAGEANDWDRVQNYTSIQHNLRFRRDEQIMDHDYVYWLGDLNFRLQMPFENAMERVARLEKLRLEAQQQKQQRRKNLNSVPTSHACSTPPSNSTYTKPFIDAPAYFTPSPLPPASLFGVLDDAESGEPVEQVASSLVIREYQAIMDQLLAADQLQQLKARGHIFQNFHEEPITFQPTYKYKIGTSQFDDSEKRRIPSWTDRILYYHNKDLNYLNINCHAYNSVPSLQTSDHKPVYGIFTNKILYVDKRVREELVREHVILGDRKFTEIHIKNIDKTVTLDTIRTLLITHGPILFVGLQPMAPSLSVYRPKSSIADLHESLGSPGVHVEKFQAKIIYRNEVSVDIIRTISCFPTLGAHTSVSFVEKRYEIPDTAPLAVKQASPPFASYVTPSPRNSSNSNGSSSNIGSKAAFKSPNGRSPSQTRSLTGNTFSAAPAAPATPKKPTAYLSVASPPALVLPARSNAMPIDPIKAMAAKKDTVCLSQNLDTPSLEMMGLKIINPNNPIAPYAGYSAQPVPPALPPRKLGDPGTWSLPDSSAIAASSSHVENKPTLTPYFRVPHGPSTQPTTAAPAVAPRTTSRAAALPVNVPLPYVDSSEAPKSPQRI